ncbi:MAG TPA: aminopeptidase N [Accumulibacter sp.]|nr:aminopeptidase N [Accumulibacter sp.]
MNAERAPTIHRLDYSPPSYLIDHVDLDVEFLSGEVQVRSTLTVRRAPATALGTPFRLDGQQLETLALAIDGQPLAAEAHRLDAQTLTLFDPPADFVLSTRVRIRPDENTSLSGLYASQDGYCTQCEAQGFRRITWFPDRPDIMARYTVTLHADRERLPVLLANGNPAGHGDEAGGRHWARWHDPFAKPCYLFALVAARLDVLRERARTSDGREVELALFVAPGQLDQCAQAMEALKRAMRWDEAVFGLACDLEHYMIVAVSDFNMGAMENKGLNIFNTKYVLARADTATDSDYQNIDRVVAHEYFHNWTGNRVTCRDWFQLSLKEGLTVFRDQEFGADTHGRALTRIRAVRTLRAVQFPEDAGPMAHPVRPEAYIEIDNFYTSTVYEKGAEVVRMLRTLIGRPAFRRGMDLYFARHDGQAVTCDDFVAAMADASGVDLRQFMRWYDHAGTPRLRVESQHDAATQRYCLTLRQSRPGNAPDKDQPFHIPVAVGLLDSDGVDLPLRLVGESGTADTPTTRILSLTDSEQRFIFANIAQAPVLSLLRDFSAPVIIDYDWRYDELEHLLAHDSDEFNRWDAGQRLASRLILTAAAEIAASRNIEWPTSFAEAMRRVLAHGGEEAAFAAEVLTLPGEATLAEEMTVVDPDALYAARRGLRRFLAERLADDWRQRYHALSSASVYQPTPAEAGRRALRNVCLGYLGELDSADNRQLAWQQFATADNMTDQFAALAVLAQIDCPQRRQALDAFHSRWQSQSLVVDKWLAVQAASRLPTTLQVVSDLLSHPSFDLHNPNKVYALLGSFGSNHRHFHAADGSGYRFLAERIGELDPLNPQVAARLARHFDRWRRFDVGRQAHARAALTRLRTAGNLSPDVSEIIDRALGA